MNRSTLRTVPIVALDYPTAEAALTLVDALGPRARFYKVGSELFTAEGPPILSAVRARGCEVFLDLKFHDIPNTVAGAVREAVTSGASLVTVHAAGGEAMLRAAVDAAGDQDRCGILAVTVLTSLTAEAVAVAWGRTEPLDTRTEVLRLASLANDAGCHGVVCSGHEVEAVRHRFGDRLAVLVPGVRLRAGPAQDQARVVTPRAASESGARYVVVGRAVTAAPDVTKAMDEVLAEIE